MKIKKLKALLEYLDEDLDINYSSGYGKQDITCLINNNGICFSNTPYGEKGNEDEISLGTIANFISKKQ